MMILDSRYLARENAARRLSDAEREAAVASLERDEAEGRLTREEAAIRSAEARAAVVRGDLAPLFADLPESLPGPPATPSGTETWSGNRAGTTFDRLGVMLIALSPFVAVVLFFLSGFATGWVYSWLWFLIIPVTAIVVSGLRGPRHR